VLLAGGTFLPRVEFGVVGGCHTYTEGKIEYMLWEVLAMDAEFSIAL